MKDQWILITAAATRTGHAIATHALAQGANVILCYRNNDKGIRDLQKKYPNTASFSCDLTIEAEVENLATQVAKITDHLYGVINVVGDYQEGPIQETDYSDYMANITNNLGSAFLTSQKFYPLLKEAQHKNKGQGARVVNFGYSQSNRVVASRAPAYQTAKLGVLTLTKTLAKEWGKDQISVNMISPGTLENSIVKDSANPSDYIPQGRFGTYEDIFVLLDMIFRPESTYFTGNNLISSGGYNL